MAGRDRARQDAPLPSEEEPAAPPPEAEPMGTESPTILEGALKVGDARLRNSALLMAMNGLIAGIFVTFSGLAAMTALGALHDVPPARAWLLASLLYPVGFIFVILGKSELFTENFLTPVLATWERRLPPWRILKLWSITFAANLAGVLVAAAAWAYPGFDLLPPETRAAFARVAEEDLGRTPLGVGAAGVVGGMLINFMSWLVIAARGPLTKLAMMYVPTFLIMLLHATHSVVGSFEVVVGIFSGANGTLVEWATDYLAPAALGNMLGGILFVSALYYAQAHEHMRVREREEGE